MAERQKNFGSKNIDKRLGALRSEIDALSGDVEGLASDAGNAADGRVHLAMRNAEIVAERAYRLAEEAATSVADDVETWTNGNLESVRGSIREQPLSALLLSIGAGALIGAAFMRR